MIADILEEHVDEAEHLFGRRLLAFEMLDLTRRDLADLDARLDAHLEGLLLDAQKSWELFAGSMAGASTERAFVAASVALGSGQPRLVAELEAELAASEAPRPGDAELGARNGQKPSAWVGLTWAAALTQWPGAVAHLRGWLERPEPAFRAAALRALGERGLDPGQALERALAGADRGERLAALGAAARSERKIELQLLEPSLSVEDEQEVSAALLATARHAPEQAAACCRQLLDDGASTSPTAAAMLGVFGDPGDLGRLAAATTGGALPLRRQALLALGNLGDPRGVPDLVLALEDPRVAGVATVALQRLLGERCPLEPASPPAPEPAVEEESGWQPDDDLPFLDAAAFRAWWSSAAAGFHPVGRYRLGIAWPPGTAPLTPLPLALLERIESRCPVMTRRDDDASG